LKIAVAIAHKALCFVSLGIVLRADIKPIVDGEAARVRLLHQYLS